MNKDALISKHFKDFSCFIKCKRSLDDGKHPDIPKGQDWNNNLISYDAANDYLKNNGNIGLVLGHGLIAIDCDTIELAEAVRQLLPSTYEEKTTSGGYHFVYRYNGNFSK